MDSKLWYDNLSKQIMIIMIIPILQISYQCMESNHQTFLSKFWIFTLIINFNY